MNIDISNAHCGPGPFPAPRPSQCLLYNQSRLRSVAPALGSPLHRRALGRSRSASQPTPWPQVHYRIVARTVGARAWQVSALVPIAAAAPPLERVPTTCGRRALTTRRLSRTSTLHDESACSLAVVWASHRRRPPPVVVGTISDASAAAPSNARALLDS